MSSVCPGHPYFIRPDRFHARDDVERQARNDNRGFPAPRRAWPQDG